MGANGPTITNPGNVWGTVANPLTSQNPEVFGRVITIRANATIVAGAAVQYVAPTATVPLSVTPLIIANANCPILFAGVSLEAAAAGEVVRIVVDGPALVNIAADTPTIGDVAKKGAANGLLATNGTIGGTQDATIVAGASLGCFLSATLGTQAWVNVGRY